MSLGGRTLGCIWIHEQAHSPDRLSTEGSGKRLQEQSQSSNWPRQKGLGLSQHFTEGSLSRLLAYGRKWYTPTEAKSVIKQTKTEKTRTVADL